MATKETMSADAKLTLLLASMGAFGTPSESTLNTARMVFGCDEKAKDEKVKIAPSESK